MKHKIIHFEDDQSVVDLYAQQFPEHGFGYVFYTSPAPDPVATVLSEQPDLVLMDMVMPGMTGFEAAALLKADERTKNIPIIALTSLGQPRHLKEGREAGINVWLVKGDNTPDQVIEKVIEQLGAISTRAS